MAQPREIVQKAIQGLVGDAQLGLIGILTDNPQDETVGASSLAAQSKATAKPANFAIVVDTSGSMVGYYQRRDPWAAA